MKILGERILIKEHKKEQTGAFHQAEATNDFIALGEVISTGESVTLAKTGDIVRVSKFAGEEFEEDKVRMKIVEEKHILAIEE